MKLWKLAPVLLCLTAGMTFAAAADSPPVPLDSSAFPDPAFLQWARQQDTDGDGSLSQAELDAVTTMDLRKQGIQDLTGLTWFHALEELNCSENDLTSLDLSGNPDLEAVYAGNNRLLAVRLPEGSAPLCDLTGQRPAAYPLETGQNGFSLRSLVPWIEPGKISQCSGAALQQDWVQLSAPNQTVTYRYTDGTAVLDAAVEVTGENGWQVPLSIANWTYGQPAALPQAQPAFGTVVFSYSSSAAGPFQPEPPATAGTWYVRAAVVETPQYNGLEAVAPFQIHPAIPNYLIPANTAATYGDPLSSVPLEPQFFWADSVLLVGDAGMQTHYAVYQPEDTVDYQIVEHIPVQVQVAPYDGTRLAIPEISSRAQADSLVITHGAWKLQEGKDYVTRFTTTDGVTQFDILFQGNYTGTVTRSFRESTGGSSGGASGSSQTFTITAAASTGGSITPSGQVSVRRGQDLTFTIRPDDGFRLEDVLIDGTPIGAADAYLFENVAQNHTIAAVFTPLHPFPTPDETGVSAYLDTQTHKAFLSGYPGGRFGPDGLLTRAQAAQLFYNLLKNQNVPAAMLFTDVPDDVWRAEAVNTLASLGKVYGVGGNRFLPDRAITRAEFVAMAMRFASPTAATVQAFPDVQPDDWYYDAVMNAAAYGWVGGNPDGTFAPNAPVTRAEAAAILNRMLGRRADQEFIASHTGLRLFADVPASHWAYFDICEAANPHHYEKESDAEIWTGLS